MSESTVWWLLAGGAVALELATGTFYLLMLAVGLSAGALAAHSGASTTVQLLAAGFLGAAAVAWLHLMRARRSVVPAGANPDVHLDVGETVMVDSWRADGTSQVRYRGACWTVVHASGTVPSTGAHRVREVLGNRLIVEKA